MNTIEQFYAALEDHGYFTPEADFFSHEQIADLRRAHEASTLVPLLENRPDIWGGFRRALDEDQIRELFGERHSQLSRVNGSLKPNLVPSLFRDWIDPKKPTDEQSPNPLVAGVSIFERDDFPSDRIVRQLLNHYPQTRVNEGEADFEIFSVPRRYRSPIRSYLDHADTRPVRLEEDEGVVVRKDRDVLTNELISCLGVLIVGPRGQALFHMYPGNVGSYLSYEERRINDSVKRIMSAIGNLGDDPSEFRMMIVGNATDYLDGSSIRREEMMRVQRAFKKAGIGHIRSVDIPLHRMTVYFAAERPDELVVMGHPTRKTTYGQKVYKRLVDHAVLSLEFEGDEPKINSVFPKWSAIHREIEGVVDARLADPAFIKSLPEKYSWIKRVLALDRDPDALDFNRSVVRDRFVDAMMSLGNEKTIQKSLDNPETVQALLFDKVFPQLAGKLVVAPTAIEAGMEATLSEAEIYSRTYERSLKGYDTIIEDELAFRSLVQDENVDLNSMQSSRTGRHYEVLEYLLENVIPTYGKSPHIMNVGAGYYRTSPSGIEQGAPAATVPQVIELALMLPDQGVLEVIDISSRPLNLVQSKPPQLVLYSSLGGSEMEHAVYQLKLARQGIMNEEIQVAAGTYRVVTYADNLVDKIKTRQMDIASDSYGKEQVDMLVCTHTVGFLETGAGNFWRNLNLVKMFGRVRVGGHLVMTRGISPKILTAFGYEVVEIFPLDEKQSVYIYKHVRETGFAQKYLDRIEEQQLRAREASVSRSPGDSIQQIDSLRDQGRSSRLTGVISVVPVVGSSNDGTPRASAAGFQVYSGIDVRQEEADSVFEMGMIEFEEEGEIAVAREENPDGQWSMVNSQWSIPEDQEQIIFDIISIAEEKGLTEIANYLELADDDEGAALFTDEIGLYRNLIENGFAGLASELSSVGAAPRGCPGDHGGSPLQQEQIVMLNAAIAAGAYEEIDALIKEIIPPQIQSQIPGMTVVGAPHSATTLRSSTFLRVVK